MNLYAKRKLFLKRCGKMNSGDLNGVGTGISSSEDASCTFLPTWDKLFLWKWRHTSELPLLFTYHECAACTNHLFFMGYEYLLNGAVSDSDPLYFDIAIDLSHLPSIINEDPYVVIMTWTLAACLTTWLLETLYGSSKACLKQPPFVLSFTLRTSCQLLHEAVTFTTLVAAFPPAQSASSPDS